MASQDKQFYHVCYPIYILQLEGEKKNEVYYGNFFAFATLASGPRVHLPHVSECLAARSSRHEKPILCRVPSY